LTKDESWSKIFYSGLVGSTTFGFGKFPLKNTKFSTFCCSGQKKISLGQVKNYPGQRQVGLLLTAGEKYARVGSGPISYFYLPISTVCAAGKAT